MTDKELDRFWAKVDKTGECWLWTAGCFKRGYGSFRLNGKMERAHSLSFRLARGDVPKGLVLDHLCRNKRCVRPEHLDPVTQLVNVRRGLVKGQEWSRGELCGTSKLTSESVLAIRALHSAGFGTHGELGEMYGVSRVMIGMIVRRRAWAWLVDQLPQNNTATIDYGHRA